MLNTIWPVKIRNLNLKNLHILTRLEVTMGTRAIVFQILLTVLFAITSASVVWSQDDAGSTIALGDVKTLEELVQVGGQLFEGKGQCAQCHSLQGEPSDKGPTLKGVGAKLTREFLHESVVNPDAYVYLDFAKIPPAPYEAPTMIEICGTVELATALIIFEPFLVIPPCSKSVPTI